MKTEYRLLAHRTFIADVYLQFKDTITYRWFFKTRTKEVWKFIPKANIAKILGYTSREQCPTEMAILELSADRYMHSFAGQEDISLIPFTKSYPDIDVYFEEIKVARSEYLKKEEQAKNLKTKYL